MYKVLSGFVETVLPILKHEPSYFLHNPFRHQVVRWKRKPRWLPTAKSKLFRVPERKKLPEIEQEELKMLWNNYRTEMKSLRIYFKEKLQLSITGPEVLAEQSRFREEDHQNCIKLNDEWNKQVKLIREARIAAEKEKTVDEIIKIIEVKEKENANRKARVEELVRIEKEKSKYYITSENIDVAIEEALTKEKDYNFAIDLECNIYEGRRAGPNKKEVEKIAQTN